MSSFTFPSVGATVASRAAESNRPPPMQRVRTWLFGRARLDEPMPWWRRYGTALFVVAVAFGLRCLFEPILDGLSAQSADRVHA